MVKLKKIATSVRYTCIS